jgi:hypothetical protein
LYILFYKDRKGERIVKVHMYQLLVQTPMFVQNPAEPGRHLQHESLAIQMAQAQMADDEVSIINVSRQTSEHGQVVPWNILIVCRNMDVDQKVANVLVGEYERASPLVEDDLEFNSASCIYEPYAGFSSGPIGFRYYPPSTTAAGCDPKELQRLFELAI